MTSPPDSQVKNENSLKELLTEIDQALDDWIVTYAADHHYPETVKAAWVRISRNGGTIAYVGNLRERVRLAMEKSQAEQNAEPVGVLDRMSEPV